jgi:hypothetical protein
MKKFFMLNSIFLFVLFLGGTANAVLIDFDSDPIGTIANGWSSDDSALVSFSDSNGADLTIGSYSESNFSNAIAVFDDYDGSALVLDFAIDISYLAFDFGNDNYGWFDPSDSNLQVTFYNDLLLVDTAFMVPNWDDLMNQTFAYSGVVFDRAEIEYVGTPINNNDGIIEVIDNIEFNPVPEPSTILLLGVGLVGIAGATRRKLKK